MNGSDAAATLVCLGAGAVAGIRWLRVSQREHYLAGSVLRFARRWWLASAENIVIAAVAAGGAVATHWWALAALVPAGATAFGPIGLGLRGRTSPLAWTRRLRTLALVWAVLQVGVVALGWTLAAAPLAAAWAAVGTPLLVDASCALVAPFERRLSSRYVHSATLKLDRIRPIVVAVTGSYGKTSTKLYVAHLLGGTRSVVASPASFNNRAGLARTVNEHLAPGTEVLVAEMGTYGRGEIADLCSWMRPEIAVITAIGPVHLERFGSEERILEAKAEIVTSASTVVLNVDDPRLKGLARTLADTGRNVVRCSAEDADADVAVPRDAPTPPSAEQSNVACALAVAQCLGVPYEVLTERLSTLPEVPSRRSVYTSDLGFTVIDDTYNSNPAGCRVALGTLVRYGRDGYRRAVVTPGMVELGSRQKEENCAFAAEAARVATDLVIVGHTNRAALLRGASSGSGGSVRVVAVATRDKAVRWVRSHLGAGDVVLYENDLPDHYR